MAGLALMPFPVMGRGELFSSAACYHYYIRLKNVAVTLVVPAWPSASFWPLLWQRYCSMIREHRYFKGT